MSSMGGWRILENLSAKGQVVNAISQRALIQLSPCAWNKNIWRFANALGTNRAALEDPSEGGNAATNTVTNSIMNPIMTLHKFSMPIK